MTLQYLDTLIGFVVVMLAVSLIITIITQIISSLLALRGSNLRWGIKTLLQHASTAFEQDKDAKQAAQDVLNHRLVSDSTFSKADSWFKRWRLASAIRKDELIDILERIAKDKDPDWADSLPEAKPVIAKWFDSTMDRVSQRFAMSMRYWTVGCAVLLAFVLHLDTPAVIKKLSTDQALRAKLVASADAMTRQTENILGAGGTNVLATALNQFKKQEPEAAKILTNPPPLLTPETMNLWLRTQLRDHPQRDKFMAAHQELVSSNVLARAPELLGAAGVLNDELRRAGYALLPNYKLMNWNDYRPTSAAFWGMVISAALLSLGAPFWYNSLKSLMNLRPVLAGRVKEEEEERRKKALK